MSVVGAIVVTYHPDLQKLGRLLRALQPQVAFTLVVDNGGTQDLSAWLSRELSPSPEHLPLGDNRGIGEAQNQGIRRAAALGATHVALFDQDSAPAPTMIADLLEGERRLLERGASVGAVGPQLYDEASGVPFRFIQFPFGLKRRVDAQRRGLEFVETHHLVASGTLIRMDVLHRVGDLRGDLFLEYVDVEWGLRARSMGLRSYGVCKASMLHNLGDRRMRVLFGLREVPLHAPVRHYYMVRNLVTLMRLPHVPLYWRVQEAIRLSLGAVVYATLGERRREDIRMMTLGLRHGLRARLGRCPS
jgi:rhamnosyltransferase